MPGNSHLGLGLYHEVLIHYSYQGLRRDPFITVSMQNIYVT